MFLILQIAILPAYILNMKPPSTCRQVATLDDQKMNTQEINAIWKDFRDGLLKFIQLKVADETLAHDILQDVFLKLIVAREEKKEIRNMQSWLFQVSRNTIHDHFRKHGKANQQKVPAMQVHEAQIDSGISGCICDLTGFIIQHYLAEPYATALFMSDIENIPQKEIAQRLGLSLSGAKSRVQRGRKMLKELILKCVEITFNQQGEVVDFQLKPNCTLPRALEQEIEKNKIMI